MQAPVRLLADPSVELALPVGEDEPDMGALDHDTLMVVAREGRCGEPGRTEPALRDQPFDAGVDQVDMQPDEALAACVEPRQFCARGDRAPTPFAIEA
jgi:hypothetical protein